MYYRNFNLADDCFWARQLLANGFCVKSNNLGGTEVMYICQVEFIGKLKIKTYHTWAVSFCWLPPVLTSNCDGDLKRHSMSALG